MASSVTLHGSNDLRGNETPTRRYQQNFEPREMLMKNTMGNTSVLKLCIQDPGIELDDVQRVSFGRGELHVPLFHVITPLDVQVCVKLRLNDMEKDWNSKTRRQGISPVPRVTREASPDGPNPITTYSHRKIKGSTIGQHGDDGLL